MIERPTTGRTKRSPPTESASSPAKMTTSFPRYVPMTVMAATSGSASATTMRSDMGVPVRAPDAAILLGIVFGVCCAESRAERPGACPDSEHLLQDRRDVVAPAVQHGSDETHAHALERAPGALHLGQAGTVGFDHDHRGIEPRAEDRAVAVHVHRRRVEDDEV